MHSLFAYFMAHPGRDFIIYYILMVGIDRMPAPTPGGNAFYKWFFGVTHIFSASWVRGAKGVAGTLNSHKVEQSPAPEKPKA